VKAEHYWAVHFDTTEAIKKSFDAQGISIPFPQRDVHMYQHKE
jgi:small conductance mechanosensitive channel